MNEREKKEKEEKEKETMTHSERKGEARGSEVRPSHYYLMSIANWENMDTSKNRKERSMGRRAAQRRSLRGSLRGSLRRRGKGRRRGTRNRRKILPSIHTRSTRTTKCKAQR